VDASSAIFRKSNPNDVKVGASVGLCSANSLGATIATGYPGVFKASNVYVTQAAPGSTLGKQPRTASTGRGVYLGTCASCHNDLLTTLTKPGVVKIGTGSKITRGAGNPDVISNALANICRVNDTYGPLTQDEIGDLSEFLKNPI
jgi:mono/diheme cytochrome c family protein